MRVIKRIEIRCGTGEASFNSSTHKNRPRKSQTPIILRPYFIFLPQKNLVGPNLSTLTSFTLGLFIQINIPSMAPTQQSISTADFWSLPYSIDDIPNTLDITSSSLHHVHRQYLLRTVNRQYLMDLLRHSSAVPWWAALVLPNGPISFHPCLVDAGA